jgi:sigma-B regulation protein RsbU (phosphoserine phosphatase)
MPLRLEELMDRSNDITLMKHLMDNVQDNVYCMDREGRIIFINQAGAKWLGFKSPQEVIGKTDLDIFTPEHGRTAYENEQHIMRTGTPLLGIEEKETWPDGTTTWVSTSKMPLRDDAGAIVGVFGISRDITAHKETELRAAQYAEENRKFRERYEDDLRMAGQLQETFLPTAYPVFPAGADPEDSHIRFYHYHHASGIVGGDFCSIRKLTDTKVGIFLCDVMGHGVHAALGTAIARALVEEISHQKRNPADFLKHMNQVLYPIMQQGDDCLFVTACYLVVDVSTGVVRMARAGHPAPILLNGSTQRAEWFAADQASCGLALALTENAEYQTVERQLHAHDAVVLFTDGIYEVAGAGQEEFGEQRLLAAVERHEKLSLRELLPALFNEARDFAAGNTFDDDVCLVGFRLVDLLPA